MSYLLAVLKHVLPCSQVDNITWFNGKGTTAYIFLQAMSESGVVCFQRDHQHKTWKHFQRKHLCFLNLLPSALMFMVAQVPACTCWMMLNSLLKWPSCKVGMCYKLMCFFFKYSLYYIILCCTYVCARMDVDACLCCTVWFCLLKKTRNKVSRNCELLE